MRTRHLLTLTALVTLVGCSSSGSGDAAVTDAASRDAAAATDAAVTDAASTDAGATDAGATDAGATDAGVMLGFEALCPTLARTVCDEAATCDCPAGPAVSACAARQQVGCERAFAGPISGVALGRLTFEPVAAAACVAAYRAAIAGCANPTDTPFAPVCARMFVDAAPLGSACAALNVGQACGAGAGTCVMGGACVALPGLDQPCLERRCAGDLVCVDDRCRPLPPPPDRAIGQMCSASRECAAGLACSAMSCAPSTPLGGACTESETCGRGATCALTSERVCRPKALEGEPCLPSDCADGLACDTLELMPVCRPRVPVGGSCARGRECVPGATCVEDLCTMLPTAGATCLFGQCASGLVCNARTQTCGDRVPAGQICSASTDCLPGLACDFSNFPGTCVARVGAGEACGGADERCADGLYCDPVSSQCATTLAVGAACSFPSQCGASAECIFPAGGSSPMGTCTALATTVDAPCGFACGGNLRCAQRPGSCVRGLCGAL